MLSGRLLRKQCHIRIYHDAHQFVKPHFRFPIRLSSLPWKHRQRAGRFPQGGRTWIVLYVRLPIQIGVGESCLGKFTHGMRFAGSHDEIIAFPKLQNSPNTFHVLRRKPQSRFASKLPRNNSFCSPCLIAATARVILRVTNVSPRRGLS